MPSSQHYWPLFASIVAWLRRERTRDRASAVLLVAAGLLVLATALATPVSRDEHMYQAAANLLAEHGLYREAAFLQPPVTIWFYAATQAFWPGDDVLLPARLAQALVSIGLGLVIWRLLRRVGASQLTATALLILLLHTEVVRGSLGLARNYELALLLSLAPWLLLPARSKDPATTWRLLAAGAVAVLAVACKLTHVAPALLVLGWPALMPGRDDDGPRGWRWLFLGAALAAGAVLLGLRGADPALVRFGLVDYHLTNARFHEASGLGIGLDGLDKLQDLRRLWRRTDLAAWSALVACAAVLRFLAPSSGAGRPNWRLGAGLIVAGMAMIAVPRPLQDSYYLLLLVGGCVLIAATIGAIRGRAQRTLGVLIAAATLVTVVHLAARDRHDLATAAAPSRWPAATLRQAGARLADALPSAGAVVFTTHPLYALEAGLPIDPVLATGEFVWRLGDHLPERWAADPRLVTATTFEAHVLRHRPEAIVVEAAAPWDAPLSDWARGQGWTMRPIAGGVVVWIPPAY